MNNSLDLVPFLFKILNNILLYCISVFSDTAENSSWLLILCRRLFFFSRSIKNLLFIPSIENYYDVAVCVCFVIQHPDCSGLYLVPTV